MTRTRTAGASAAGAAGPTPRRKPGRAPAGWPLAAAGPADSPPNIRDNRVRHGVKEVMPACLPGAVPSRGSRGL